MLCLSVSDPWLTPRGFRSSHRSDFLKRGPHDPSCLIFKESNSYDKSRLGFCIAVQAGEIVDTEICKQDTKESYEAEDSDPFTFPSPYHV